MPSATNLPRICLPRSISTFTIIANVECSCEEKYVCISISKSYIKLILSFGLGFGLGQLEENFKDELIGPKIRSTGSVLFQFSNCANYVSTLPTGLLHKKGGLRMQMVRPQNITHANQAKNVSRIFSIFEADDTFPE